MAGESLFLPKSIKNGEKITEKNISFKGDFNGDGLEDEARILINKHENKMGLFALFQSPTGISEPFFWTKVKKNFSI